jgi:cytoskeletal protein RodZ
MTPPEPAPESLEPAGSAEPPTALAETLPEQPASSEQYVVFLHHRAQGRARRERRRRQLRIAVGTLVAGAWLLTAVLFWTRHQRTPIATRIVEPPAAPAWQSVESRAARRDAPASPAPSPPAVTPPASPRASTAPRPATTPVAPTSPPPAASTPTPPAESPTIAARPVPPAAAPAPSPVVATPAPSAARVTASPVPPTPPALVATPGARVSAVSYQPRERLASVHAGDPKETVFELFGTVFERRNGSLVRVEGMRLRATGRSSQHAQVEVAEVRINDTTAAGNLYWFLFGDDRLIAWGRAEDWPLATARYQVDIEYHPDPASAGRRSADRS